MPSVPGKMGNNSSERAAVLESLTSKVTSFVLFSANPSAILWEYGLWKYAASRILLPKLRIYFVLAKSGVSMSGPHVGSIPIFFGLAYGCVVYACVGSQCFHKPACSAARPVPPPFEHYLIGMALIQHSLYPFGNL